METITIQIKVSPEVVTRYGQQALTERIQKFIEWDELSLKAQKINQALQEAGIDFDTMAEEVRKESWQDYKQKHLKDILP